MFLSLILVTLHYTALHSITWKLLISLLLEPYSFSFHDLSSPSAHYLMLFINFIFAFIYYINNLQIFHLTFKNCCTPHTHSSARQNLSMCEMYMPCWLLRLLHVLVRFWYKLQWLSVSQVCSKGVLFVSWEFEGGVEAFDS